MKVIDKKGFPKKFIYHVTSENDKSHLEIAQIFKGDEITIEIKLVGDTNTGNQLKKDCGFNRFFEVHRT